ncbi:hypothetical protein CR513_44400, partial [Mucuna pruriens]
MLGPPDRPRYVSVLVDDRARADRTRGASSFIAIIISVHIPKERRNSSVRLFTLLFLKSLRTYYFSNVFDFLLGSFSQGLPLTLAFSSTGDLFEDVPDPSAQGDQSLVEATPGRRFEAPRDEPSGSSSGSFNSYPFEVWYRDDTRDSLGDDPYFWVDAEVKRMSTLLNRFSSLLGMAKAICQKEPWSVRVSPCRAGESVNTTTPADDKPCFYLYDTLHSKLGIKLPFSHFERAVLQVLNVAPTQLHPNGWAYVRAFELLCEDLQKAPTLGVFFLKAEKVGWTSLCNRLKRKLFQPFLASYKKFKTWFFKVTPGDTGPNLLVDRSGRPFFPLSWTHQPAVSISVNLEDLESWEKEFAKELGELPLLPSAKIIKGVDYSSRSLRELKKRKAALMAEGDQQAAVDFAEPSAVVASVEPSAAVASAEPSAAVASAEPIAAAEPFPLQETTDEASNSTSLVVLNNAASSPIAEKFGGDSPPRSEERPLKRPHVEEPHSEDAEVKTGSQPAGDFQWDSLLARNPASSTVMGPPLFLGQAVDKGLALVGGNKVKQLGEFGRLEFQNRSSEERVEKIQADFLHLSKVCTEKEIKINSYRSANAALEEDLQRTVAKNKDLMGKNFDLDMAIDHANAKVGVLKQKNEDLEASNSNLRAKLALAESSLKQALEDIQARDETIQSRDQAIQAQDQVIKTHERTIIEMGGDIVEQFEAGFAKALEQVRFLHPTVDVSEADPFKEFVDEQFVLVPTPPSSPAPQ